MSDIEIIPTTLVETKTRKPRLPKTIEPMNPMGMLSLAVQQGADLDKLEKLMDLQDRYEKTEARKAYTRDMTDFKANAPVLIKDKLVKAGNASWRHAELDQVAGKIGEALSRHGFSHRWDIQQTDKVTVTCTITHVLGHSESVTLSAPPDASGSKAPIQQIASTLSYLERYTILAITGLATGEADTDGVILPQNSNVMPEAVFQAHIRRMEEANTLAELQVAYSNAYKEAKDKTTQDALMRLKDIRKAEINGGAK